MELDTALYNFTEFMIMRCCTCEKFKGNDAEKLIFLLLNKT